MEQNLENQERYMDAANHLNLLALHQSAGVVYWKPDGYKVYENLQRFIQRHHQRRHYLQVKSPSIVAASLFEQSGHMQKYREYIFMADEHHAMRPMSCPNHIVIYQSEKRSYRQLPCRIFEFGDVYRNEPSGSLQVLFRQRQFCQDDSHVFVAENQLIQSVSDYLQMSAEVYKELGFDEVHYDISLRPKERFGDDVAWDKAEEALRQSCRLNGIAFNELPGEGAFYGPKIELKVKDKLGRMWQLGVIQLDYVLPERFDLSFVNEHNAEERPVILHHAVLGSLERMIGILLESFGVNLPRWLHPVPAMVICVSEKSKAYAEVLAAKLEVQADLSDEPLGKKLQMWRAKGVPDIYVVGEKEAAEYAESGVMAAMLNRGKEKVRIEV